MPGKLKEKATKLREMENAKLLYSNDKNLCSNFPPRQQKRLPLMPVLAPGVMVTTDMLANLWDQV